MKLYKELLVNQEIDLSCYVDRIKQYPKVVLYGAGKSGKAISKWLKENDIFPKAFVDSNLSKQGLYINGIKVYSKEEVLKKFDDAFFIISCGDYAMLLSELSNSGVAEDKIMYIDPKWISQPDGVRNFVDNHIRELQEVYDILGDDLSQKVFLNMLKYKMSYRTEYIKEIYSDWKERYFDRQLIKNRIIKDYVDAGGITAIP